MYIREGKINCSRSKICKKNRCYIKGKKGKALHIQNFGNIKNFGAVGAPKEYSIHKQAVGSFTGIFARQS